MALPVPDRAFLLASDIVQAEDVKKRMPKGG